MTKVSFIGTLSDIEITATSDDLDIYSFKIKEDLAWDVMSDTDTYPDCDRLQKGRKYILVGELHFIKPEIIVYEIVEDASKLNVETLSEKDCDNVMLSLSGKISESTIYKTMKEKEDMSLVNFDGLADVDVVFFPDLWTDAKKANIKDNEITVIGEYDQRDPHFVIEHADLIS